MRQGRMIFAVLALCATTVWLSGCKPTYIKAKTRVIDAQSITNFEDLVLLVRDPDNAAPSERSRAESLRQGALAFSALRELDFSLYGDPNNPFTIFMLAVSQVGNGSTFPEPTELAIYTTAGHQQGETTRNGYADIRFGPEGPVYTTNLPDTFFEMTVSDVYENQGDRMASGTFSMIARNKDDQNDTQRLLVMDGAFITRVK